MVASATSAAIGRTANARQTRWKRPMSIFDLTGRVAVITGGNGGIGLGIAQALAAAGCNVSIWGRNAEKNKTAAATMAGAAGKVDTRVCDVTDPASVKAAMAATLETLRPRRRLFRQCRHRRRRTPRLHRPHRGTVAQHVRHQSRRRVSCVSGRRAPHDRTRRGGRSVRPAGRDLEPRLAVRHRAQRALRRDQGRHQRAGARARGRTGAPGRHRRTRSCPAGSRAT